MGTRVPCGRECKGGQPPWKTAWGPLRELHAERHVAQQPPC